MRLDAIPKGARVLLDANIVLYASFSQSKECARLLERCARGELEGVLPVPALAEIHHRLMISEAKAAKLVQAANPAKQLAAKPALVRQLEGHRRITQSLLAQDFATPAAEAKDLLAALEIQAEHGFLTNDALVLAIARRLEIPFLASADRAFKAVKGLTCCGPADLNHGS